METWNVRWGLFRAGIHALTALLLLLVVVRGLRSDASPHIIMILICVAAAAIYAVGLTPAVRDDRRSELLWLGALIASWFALLAVAPDAIYLGFPLSLLAADSLSNRWGPVVVTAIVGGAIVGWTLHMGPHLGAIVGPLLAGTAAVAMVHGMRSVSEDSERRGVLEERRRLAREVHDTLAQGFTSINLMLGGVGEILRNLDEVTDADIKEVAEIVREAQAVAVDNIGEARHFLHELSPPQWETTPLMDAVRKLVACEPAAQFAVTGQPRALPATHSTAALRIVSEALTNAAVHAHATRIDVQIDYREHSLGVQVVDNGRGFNAGVPKPGYGVNSMRTRASELGGYLQIDSVPGHGTTVSLSLPTREGGPVHRAAAV